MSLALLGGRQPDRLSQALSGADDGLAARLCYIWPDPLPIVGLAAESDDSAWDRRGRLDSATLGCSDSSWTATASANRRRVSCVSTNRPSPCSARYSMKPDAGRALRAASRPAGTARCRGGFSVWRVFEPQCYGRLPRTKMLVPEVRQHCPTGVRVDGRSIGAR
jgi:hypothetical protein